MNAKTWLVIGACLGGLAVALGAFGAHGLPRYYQLLDAAAGDALRHKGPENWEIAARYHIYHALAMVLVGILADRKRHWLLDAAGLAFFFGILIFSGCLYALALTGTKVLGAIVPIGGVLFIVGWVLLALAGNQFAAAEVLSTSQPLKQPSDLPPAGANGETDSDVDAGAADER